VVDIALEFLFSQRSRSYLTLPQTAQPLGANSLPWEKSFLIFNHDGHYSLVMGEENRAWNVPTTPSLGVSVPPALLMDHGRVRTTVSLRSEGGEVLAVKNPFDAGPFIVCLAHRYLCGELHLDTEQEQLTIAFVNWRDLKKHGAYCITLFQGSSIVDLSPPPSPSIL